MSDAPDVLARLTLVSIRAMNRECEALAHETGHPTDALIAIKAALHVIGQIITDKTTDRETARAIWSSIADIATDQAKRNMS